MFFSRMDVCMTFRIVLCMNASCVDLLFFPKRPAKAGRSAEKTKNPCKNIPDRHADIHPGDIHAKFIRNCAWTAGTCAPKRHRIGEPTPPCTSLTRTFRPHPVSTRACKRIHTARPCGPQRTLLDRGGGRKVLPSPVWNGLRSGLHNRVSATCIIRRAQTTEVCFTGSKLDLIWFTHSACIFERSPENS